MIDPQLFFTNKELFWINFNFITFNLNHNLLYTDYYKLKTKKIRKIILI